MNNKLILVTAITENFYEKTVPYLKSIQLFSNFDENLVITLNFLKNNVKKIKHLGLDENLIINKNNNHCIQHGEFLKCDYFKNYNDNDILCFTDSDILMQRSLNQDEIKLFSSLTDDEVLVQYNKNDSGTLETLEVEYGQLSPSVSIAELESILETSLKDHICYNTGIVICNIKTWKKIQQKYSEYFPKIQNSFVHYAKQQWILSYIFNKYLKVKLLKYSEHCHYHHGRVLNSVFNSNTLYFNNEIVLFNHYCMDLDLPMHKGGFYEQQIRFLKMQNQ
jgi:hypothetical protein